MLATMSPTTDISRRRFLRTTGAAIAIPTFISSSSLGLAGTISPSNRITLGLIGCGLHGAGWNLSQIFRNDDSQVIAVCDVDAKSHEELLRRVSTAITRKCCGPSISGLRRAR